MADLKPASAVSLNYSVKNVESVVKGTDVQVTGLH